MKRAVVPPLRLRVTIAVSTRQPWYAANNQNPSVNLWLRRPLMDLSMRFVSVVDMMYIIAVYDVYSSNALN